MSVLIPDGCVVVAGFAAEAGLLPPGTPVILSGGSSTRLDAQLESQGRIRAILSFGIAGGLDPGLPVGRLLVAARIVDGAREWPTDPAWSAALVHASGAHSGPLAASPVVVGSAAAKSALFSRTGAMAVDMESGVAARFAAERGLPFATLRAIADPADDALVPSAAAGLNLDGSAAPLRVLAALMQRPQDLPGLLRIARQSARALKALRLAVGQATA